MGNKKSRQDLLGYDLSSDTDEEEEEVVKRGGKEDDVFIKSEVESPEMMTSSPDIMTSSKQYADNLRKFENRSKDPDVEADDLDFSK